MSNLSDFYKPTENAEILLSPSVTSKIGDFNIGVSRGSVDSTAAGFPEEFGEVQVIKKSETELVQYFTGSSGRVYHRHYNYVDEPQNVFAVDSTGSAVNGNNWLSGTTSNESLESFDVVGGELVFNHARGASYQHLMPVFADFKDDGKVNDTPRIPKQVYKPNLPFVLTIEFADPQAIIDSTHVPGYMYVGLNDRDDSWNHGFLGVDSGTDQIFVYGGDGTNITPAPTFTAGTLRVRHTYDGVPDTTSNCEVEYSVDGGSIWSHAAWLSLTTADFDDILGPSTACQREDATATTTYKVTFFDSTGHDVDAWSNWRVDGWIPADMVTLNGGDSTDIPNRFSGSYPIANFNNLQFDDLKEGFELEMSWYGYDGTVVNPFGIETIIDAQYDTMFVDVLSWSTFSMQQANGNVQKTHYPGGVETFTNTMTGNIFQAPGNLASSADINSNQYRSHNFRGTFKPSMDLNRRFIMDGDGVLNSQGDNYIVTNRMTGRARGCDIHYRNYPKYRLCISFATDAGGLGSKVFAAIRPLRRNP